MNEEHFCEVVSWGQKTPLQCIACGQKYRTVPMTPSYSHQDAAENSQKWEADNGLLVAGFHQSTTKYRFDSISTQNKKKW